MHKLLIFFLLIGLNPIFAKEIGFYSGEYHVPDYYGPEDITYRLKKANGTIVPNDRRETYFEQKTEEDIFQLMSFWENDLSSTANCPNQYLAKNYSYIRYLYRLQALSYLFEGLKQYDYHANLLGINLKECSLKYQDVFSKCASKSLEMKKFVERAQHRYEKNFNFSSYSVLTKDKQRDWLQDFYQTKKPELLSNQLEHYCMNNMHTSKCAYMLKSDMQKAFSYLCKRDKKLIQNICSETDTIYGLSYSEHATTLIGQSNAFKIINKEGKGYSCLERYSRIHSGRERKFYFLNDLFKDVFKNLIQKKSKYLQGQLFLPGALKEFDEKGLSAFLFVPEKPLVIPPIKKYFEDPIYIAAAPKPAPRPVKLKKIKKPVVAEKKPVKKVKKKSAFYKALVNLSKKKLSMMDVDMGELKNDFIFTEQMVDNLSEPLADYQTRSGLQEMVAYDKMGSVDNPIRLLFIKYLIDTESHQGLYNIQSVLGNYFYVENDIDRQKGPVYINLKLDESTNHTWQLTILDKKLYEKELKEDQENLQ